MQQSGQTYLETIYLLKRENGRVKSIDVAKALGFSKPSVSRAMGKLKAEGYLEVGEKGELVLTKEGNKIAKDLVEKQETQGNSVWNAARQNRKNQQAGLALAEQ